MNMHLWAEQHSWLCGWVPNEMWKMSLPQCIVLLVLTLLFWVEWGIGCVLNDCSLHQSGHLVSAPSISMPRLSNLEKARAIGQVEAGVPQNQVAALFGVSPGTISKLKAKFCETGDIKDRPRSGRPKKTTPQEDRFITLKLPICLVYSLLLIGSWLLLIESCLLLIQGWLFCWAQTMANLADFVSTPPAFITELLSPQTSDY